jgi:hypothetical protein
MIPKALRVVAVIHLVGGLMSVARIVVQLTQGTIGLDLGVLGIPIYFGLMRLSSGWRSCALVFIWLGILLTPIIFVIGLKSGLPGQLHIFGVPVGSISPIWISVASVLWFLLNLWQYRVLTRDDIKRLFVPPTTRNVFDLV